MRRPSREAIREYLTLATARESVGALSEAECEARWAAIDEARLERHAADALWARGHRDVSLALTRSAIGRLRAFAATEPSETRDEATPDVRSSDESDSDEGSDEGADQSDSDEGADESDSDESDSDEGADATNWRALRAGLRRDYQASLGALELSMMSASQLQWLSRLRIAGVVLAVLGALALVWFVAIDPPERVEAEATGQFGAGTEFSPQNVVDSDPTTEWLLPDHQRGFLEIEITPPRDMTRVEILNGRNMPFADRGTHHYTIELYAVGAHWTETGTLAAPDAEQEWVGHDIDARDVRRIRFTVAGHHGIGASVAEIRWEER